MHALFPTCCCHDSGNIRSWSSSPVALAQYCFNVAAFQARQLRVSATRVAGAMEEEYAHPYEDSIENFTTYEDYLDSQITAQDRFYLEEDELARQLVEIGQKTATLPTAAQRPPHSLPPPLPPRLTAFHLRGQ